jgi:oligopeptide transport system permease protein
MVWKIIKQLFIIFIILLGFALLLLLPREMKLTRIGPLSIIAEFPFTMDLYKHNIKSFIDFIYTEKGLGQIRTGMKVSENTIMLFLRSLTIILPCFMASFFFGIILGAVQFRSRDKTAGRIFSFISWLSSSVPDFFVYIAFQYLLIKLFSAGLIDFNLYGDENWYSFLLPTLALTVFPMAHIAKSLFVSLLHESKQDYIRTSIAKGMNERKVLIHMLRNCSGGLLHQTQIVMLYILTSLPIIEKLSNFRGAGYQLLENILHNEDNSALGLMIPFLILMLLVITAAQLVKPKLMPIRKE